MSDGVKTVNLALQGGGAHGAFTWGVLDCLLGDPRIRIEAVSGTSAGAINGVIGVINSIPSIEIPPVEVLGVTVFPGLTIAIPVNIGYNFFVTRIDQLIVDMEHGAQKIINLAWDLEKDGKIEIVEKGDSRWPATEGFAAQAAASSPPPSATPNAPDMGAGEASGSAGGSGE